MPILIACLTFAGCGAVQHAVYHKPSIVGSNLKVMDYGDGISFKIKGLCLAVRESPRSAHYNNLAAGPIGVPLFPLRIADSNVPEKSLLEIEISFESDGESFEFYPGQVNIQKEDETHISPVQIKLYNQYYDAGVNSPERDSPEKIELYPPETPRLKHSTTVTFLFNNISSPGLLNLSIKGLNKGGKEVFIPLISLKKQSDTRYLISGMVSSNLYVWELGRICEIAKNDITNNDLEKVKR